MEHVFTARRGEEEKEGRATLITFNAVAGVLAMREGGSEEVINCAYK